MADHEQALYGTIPIAPELSQPIPPDPSSRPRKRKAPDDRAAADGGVSAAEDDISVRGGTATMGDVSADGNGGAGDVGDAEMDAYESGDDNFQTGAEILSSQGSGSRSRGGERVGKVDKDDFRRKKRNRPILSCTECKRRKIKCDRRIPCEQCVKRGMPNLCKWDTGQAPPQPWALSTELHEVQARLSHLETLFARLPQEALASLATTSPSTLASGAIISHRPSNHASSSVPSRSGLPISSNPSTLSAPALASRKAKLFPGSSNTTTPNPVGGVAGDMLAASATGNIPVALGRSGGAVTMGGKEDGSEAEEDEEEEVDLDELGIFKISGMWKPDHTTRPGSRGGEPSTTRDSLKGTGTRQAEDGVGDSAFSNYDGSTGRVASSSRGSCGMKPPDAFPEPAPGENSTIFVDLDAELPLNLDCEPLGDPNEERDKLFKSISPCLPDKTVSDFLTNTYLSNLEWTVKALHVPTFRQEYKTFWRYRDSCAAKEAASGKEGDRTSSDWIKKVDPLWLSLLFMVYCLSLDAANKDAEVPYPLNTLSTDKLSILPLAWFRCAMRCLRLGDWTGIPRIRTCQCILLLSPFVQVTGFVGGGYMVWIAAALRICQMMGLHRLGSDPTIMPPPDPAYPNKVPNTLARELAKRVFNGIAAYENLNAKGNSLINLAQCTTDRLANVNEDEWLADAINGTKPETEWTTATFEIYRAKLGDLLRQLYDSLTVDDDLNYDRILSFDEAFHDLLASVDWVSTPNLDMENEDCRIGWARNLGQQGAHNRLMRLHQPYLGKALAGEKKYQYSARACLRSARIVLAAQRNLLNAPTGTLWYTYHHALSSAIVLFQYLFHAIDHEIVTDTEDVNESFQQLYSSLDIFRRGLRPNSPAINHLAQQGLAILEALYQRARDRRKARNRADPDSESFASIIRDVVHAHRTGNSTTCSPNASSKSNSSGAGDQGMGSTSNPSPTGRCRQSMSPGSRLGLPPSINTPGNVNQFYAESLLLGLGYGGGQGTDQPTLSSFEAAGSRDVRRDAGHAPVLNAFGTTELEAPFSTGGRTTAGCTYFDPSGR